MTLLIKGMEMPATGGFITLQICGDGTVRVVNKATGGVYIAPTFEEANGTDERIRASSVPAPHGRLIDADVIPYVVSENGCTDDYAYRYDIYNLPTVIEAEEG